MTQAGRPSTAPAQHITRSTTKFASSRLAQVDENDRDDGQAMIKSKLRMPASAVEEVEDDDQVDYEDDGSSDGHSTRTPHRASATLKKRVLRLAEENEDLKLENETLKERNTDLEGDIEGLELQNRTLKLENESLNRLIELNKKSTYFESQISSNDDGTETIE